jgi:hypothetical protein
VRASGDTTELMSVSRDRQAVPELGAPVMNMKIAGWKTPSMFRRYDIQDGKDIQRAGRTMEKWIAARKVADATADSTSQPSALQASKSDHVN